MNNPMKLSFCKEYLKGGVLLSQFGTTFSKCGLYTITDDNAEIGRFYADARLAIADFDGLKVIITQERKLFKRTTYTIKSLDTNSKVATLKYSLPFDSTSATVEIPNEPKYYWHR
jgi:hypothetical protein